MIRELYFVDQARIESCLDQLDPKTLGKVKWPKFEVKIPWPIEIKVSTGIDGRETTQAKRIDALKRSLERADQLAFMRPDGDHIERPFVLEICEAQRFAVPSSKSSDDAPGLIFWLSTKKLGLNERASHLCLLENFRHSDVAAVSFWHTSAYSLLVSLVYYARAEIDASAAAEFVPNDPPQNPYAKFGTASHPYSLQEWQNAKEYLYEFIDDPVGLLGRWKCTTSEPRRIETLYRIREWGPESARSGSDISIFGYPLWIRSA